MAKFKNEPQLLIIDTHGIYIPQLWAADVTEADCAQLNLDWEDVQTVQAGPDHELYWEAWNSIEQSCEMTDEDGDTWYLFQNGDLWAIPTDWDPPEDWI